MNKQQLANKIWASANKMRSKIEANEYKDYILGLIFYKFLSDNEVNYLKSIGWTDEDLVTLVEDHVTNIHCHLFQSFGCPNYQRSVQCILSEYFHLCFYCYSMK